jgi:hypothetical protein
MVFALLTMTLKGLFARTCAAKRKPATLDFMDILAAKSPAFVPPTLTARSVATPQASPTTTIAVQLILQPRVQRKTA